jgi:hypothetical protein
MNTISRTCSASPSWSPWPPGDQTPNACSIPSFLVQGPSHRCVAQRVLVDLRMGVASASVPKADRSEQSCTAAQSPAHSRR